MDQDNRPRLIYPRRYRLLRFRRYDTDLPEVTTDPVDPLDVDYPTAGAAGEVGAYVPDVDDFSPSPPKPLGPLSRVPSSRSLRPALLCFALFFVFSFQYWSAPGAGGGWASRAAVVEGGQWWRLFTALFTHADLGHLLANTPLFLFFGWHLRAYFGLAIFPAAALLIGAASNLATLAFYTPDTRLVGASGMLYGMVALWLVLYVRFETIYSVGMRIFRAIGVSLLLLFPTTFQETTSYAAHFWGFIIGLVVGLALSPFLKVQDPDVRVSTTLPFRNPEGTWQGH